MSLRARILLLLAIVAAAVLAMAAMVYLTIRGTDFYRQRVALAHQQLAAMVELAKTANQFSAEITEVLLLGEQQWPDFVVARGEVEAAFGALEAATRAEVGFLQGWQPEVAERETDEFVQIAELRRIYGEIDRSVEHLVLLQDSGRRADALIVYRDAIERRLDAEFEQLLAAAVADEHQEVDEAQAAAARLADRLSLALVLTAVMSLTVSIGAVYLLNRSLSGSVRRLMQGAAAISEGDLDHRIAIAGNDELAVLSRRFNEMAARIEDQQRRLVLVQRQLECQVQERTGELRSANERLRHLDQSRVQFLADISHELRTPLTILRGEAEVSLRGAGKSEAEYREALQQIVAQAAQMSALVDDLMFLARSEAGTIRFETRPVVLQDVLSAAMAAGQALTGRNGVRLEGDWAAAPIRVQADPERLRQALVILVDNAIKYSDNADTVRVEARNVAGMAEVSVIDHGPGIPGRDLPYVFERFYRGEGGSGGERGGSGLGLSIARWIVEKHGGAISVISEPDRRTEFRLRLPLDA
jgi:signal transduction histidine kinase